VPKEYPSQATTQETPIKTSKVEKVSDATREAFELIIPKHNYSRLKLEEFEGSHDSQEIERDSQAVENKKKKIVELDMAPTMRAQFLEAILAEQVELSNWFSENTMTIIPSEYDDLFNGIDLVLEFETEETSQYETIGIDVSSSPLGIKRKGKFDKIKQHIVDGTLAQMKYFHSERGDTDNTEEEEEAKPRKMPLFIIGADPRIINELAELWLTVYKARNPGKNLDKIQIDELREKAKKAQEKLAKHRVAVMILQELKEQLEVFAQFAQKINSQEIATKFIKLLKVVTRILRQKKISVTEQQYNESDDVYKSIRDELNVF